jgi:hypothetical protein
VEGAAKPWHALDPDLAAVLLHEAARDVQSEPQPGKTAIVNVARSVKPLEHQWLILDRDADALVAHAQSSLSSLLPDRDAHRRMRRAVLERILDEIGNDLLEARRIHVGNHVVLDAELHALPATKLVSKKVFDHGGQTHWLALADEAALLETRHVEQLENQVLEPIALIEQSIEADDIGRRLRIAVGTA